MKLILMEYTMYDTLLMLPLFQGMSKTDLTRIIEKVQFHFVKFEDKEVVSVKVSDVTSWCFCSVANW